MPGENFPAFVRLFIALPVPEGIRAEIGRAQGRLKRCSPPGAIRWTRPEQFHVTLKFLGDFPAAQLNDLKQAVATACNNVGTLKLSAQAMGFFPKAAKPRVLWVGVRDEDDLLGGLQQRIHAVVLPFAPADRSERFAGHITLGRFKPGRHGSLEELLAQAAKFRASQFGDWLGESVELVRSELTPVGATHEAIATFKLTSENESSAGAM